MLADAKERSDALDVTRSFLVQAPAGSGKTSLLIQRMLTLLLVVNKRPEECLAITFTKKAAAEMRARIIQALNSAQNEPCPTKPHAAAIWQLAKKVLARDKQLNWQLTIEPKQLNIQTIDAFSHKLVRALPIASNITNVTAESHYMYINSARNLLFANDSTISHQVKTLLYHLDNKTYVAEQLLANLLQTREQWLEYLFTTSSPAELRCKLQQSLKNVALVAIAELRLSLPIDSKLPIILSQLGCLGEAELNGWPQATSCQLDVWRQLAELLLTKSGSLRKTLRNIPSLTGQDEQTKEFKRIIQAELRDLAERENLHLWERVRAIPPSAYRDNQWQLVQSLLILLPRLYAELKLIFQAEGRVDFTEIALIADSALGSLDNPSDLTMALDYKISHILVDEFQDTSVLQYKLLQKLTQTWLNNDGRTLFLVGDPQQSIYRFRQANIGLYHLVKINGINNVTLDYLALSCNFRSSPTLVKNCNRIFQKVLNSQISSPRVAFTPSQAIKEDTDYTSFSLNWRANSTTYEEAEAVVATIQSIQAKHPNLSIAILVRTRAHLNNILPALNLANIDYRGTDITALRDKSYILGLIAITKALFHLADNASWLAILRAPWCALSLNACELLTRGEDIVYTALQNNITRLSKEEGELAARVYKIFQLALNKVGIVPTSILVRDVWQQLGGPNCLRASEIADTEVFFTMLTTIDADRLYDAEYLAYRLDKLFSNPMPITNNPVEIMTIHKAKGLEFDVVLIPGLDRSPSRLQDELLLWDLQFRDSGQGDLLLAPIKAADEYGCPIYDFLRRTIKDYEYDEARRLLYVALTRAKQQLYLFGFMSGEKPKSNSFLSLCWQENVPEYSLPTMTHTADKKTSLLMRSTHLPEANLTSNLYSKNKTLFTHETLMNKWKPALGQALHRLFWSLSKLKELPESPNFKIEYIHTILLRYGVPMAQLEQSYTIIMQALTNTLNCPQGRWLLAGTDCTDTQSEWELGYQEAGRPHTLIVDRTFIFQGERWIVDYKLILDEDYSATVLLDRYNPQLTKYHEVISQMYPDVPIRCALYLPLQAEMLEVELEIV